MTAFYDWGGPSSAYAEQHSTPFSVSLRSPATLARPVIISPSDNGGGGTFAPSRVTLSRDAPRAAFTYRGAQPGRVMLSVSSGDALADPAPLILELAPAPLSVLSPAPFVVVQRGPNERATVAVRGVCTIKARGIEARFNGGAWTRIAGATNADSEFSGALPNQNGGQGALEVRATGTDFVATVAPVGVGELFLCAGQSNMSGRGFKLQTSAHPTLQACLLGNDGVWKTLRDPYDDATNALDSVSSDANAKGSYVPLLATRMMSALNVPVAFVPCARGGSSVTMWQPSTQRENRRTLLGSAVARAKSAGGVRAVLWHQGETDALQAIDALTYETQLSNVVDAFARDLNAPTVIAQLQNSRGIEDARELIVRAAVERLLLANRNARPGPDLALLSSDDAYHLQSDASLNRAADLWWRALQLAFFPAARDA